KLDRLAELERLARLEFCLLNDLHHTPALSCRQRPRFNDLHLVADLRTLLVVRHKFLALADVLAIDRVLDQAVHANDDRVRHLVGGDGADLLSTLASLFLGGLALAVSLFGLRCIRFLGASLWLFLSRRRFLSGSLGA